ncbi:unnamed protein product [Rhizophagus irregularis]|nr:unnamed protein product [Rhizophagus irregularis]
MKVVSQSVKTDDNSDCNCNSYVCLKQMMPEDSDDDGYNDYGGYNEYGERDRGYYYRDRGYERKTSPMMSPIISPSRVWFVKKNKRHIQSTPSANETQSRSLIVTDTELLAELTHQGLIVDEVHEVLSYDRKSMPWVDNFINLSIKLKNQCDDSREKAYHSLMRELFSMKAFRDASSQDGLFPEAEYYRNNKIDNRITDFITQPPCRPAKV